jgi:CubicO group peptidase (beta-lactamase class C family)
VAFLLVFESAPAQRLSEHDALASFKGEIERAAARDLFAGAVLVAKNGRTVFSGAWGLADRERKVANRLETRFRIGSMNKMFTAVAVAQLAGQKKLKFSDTLGQILPGYPNKDVAAKVTVHHLLTHTGGTGDIFGPQFREKRLELRELQDYVSLYGKRGLEFEPGSRWAYSNYGFVLLGMIVEKVSGQSYYDYVREHVFKPAEMTRTGSLPESEKVLDRSVGYMRPQDGAWTPNTDTLPWRGTSAGGGYSTVEDLARFAHALLAHKLLDAQHTALVTAGKVATPRDGWKYAYGFADNTEDGVRRIGHGGGAPGMNGELRIFPGSGYVVAVLSNLDPPAASRLADFLTARLPAR